jgi:methionyl-tRNA formyltransferase
MSIEHLSEFLRIVVENGDSDFLSEPRTQPEELSSYYPRLRSEVNGCINWGWTVSQIERFIRAFDDPYAGAFCRLTGRVEKVILKDVSILPSAFESFHPYQSGLIIRIDDNQLYVACNGGLLSVARVISSDNNGDLGIIRPGDRFYSLSTDLDDSVSSRQFYSPS